MLRKCRSISVVSRSIVLLAVVVLASSWSHAQVEKPFKISGEGVGPSGIPLPGDPAEPHWIIGNATHLGKHFGFGEVETEAADFSDFPERITGTFGSGVPFVFTGANGDNLVCNYGRDIDGGFTGVFELEVLDAANLVVKAFWIAEFVPVPEECTGKFAGVTGSWTMFANSAPFVLGSDDPLSYAWEGVGSLTFEKK